MKKILIIGSSGAGKSTLALQLGAILSLRVIHLDAHFWNPGWVETPDDEWRRVVETLLVGEEWIIEGNYGGTFDIRMPAADTIIFLDFPRLLCTWRILKRWQLYKGRTRPDLAPACPEKIDMEFLQWVWNFPRRTRPSLLEKLAVYGKDKQVIVLHTAQEVRAFLASVGK